MKKLIFLGALLVFASCKDSPPILEEISCVETIELDQWVIHGEAYPNRHVILEDIYLKKDTIIIQTTYEYGLDQYRIFVEHEGNRIDGGYKWWNATLTPPHLHRKYKIPAIIPDCYDNIDITFGVFDDKIQDYIELKTVNLKR